MAENFSEAMCKLKRGEINEGRRTSTIASLPREIMLDMLSRLPITSLMNAKFICRSWLDLADDSLLPSLHFNHVAGNDLCLILHCDYPIQSQLYFVDFSAHNEYNGPAFKRIRVPRMKPEFDVVGSCNGLLCICDSLSKNSIYIYNPFTRDNIELPEPKQFSNQLVSIAFGFDSTAKKYKVVRIVYYRNVNAPHPIYRSPEQSSVQILTLGSFTWRIIGKVAYRLNVRSYHVLVNGRIHWLDLGGWNQADRKIVSFDFADEQFLEVPKPDCIELEKSKSLLANIGGCLSAVLYHGSLSLRIWVMKEYGVKESWTKEFIIGDYLPRGLKQRVDPSFKFSKLCESKIHVRVLCLLKNGEILLEYANRALVSFDPVCRKFKELTFQGMPKWFETVIHTGSLNWIDTPVDM